MFLREPEAIQFAKSLVDEQREIIRYNPLVYLTAIGPDAVLGNLVELDSLVENLRQHGFDAMVSKYPNTIEIRSRIDGDDREALQAFFDSVDQMGLLLSAKNKFGFVTGGRCSGEVYRGQPFSMHVGRQQCMPKTVTAIEVQRVKDVWADEIARAAAEAIQLIFSQVTPKARLMAAWAAIEEQFNCEKPQHLLSNDELDALLAAVAKMDAITEAKKDVLYRLLKNSTNVSERTRNERIANKIAELTRDDYESVLKSVRDLADARARQVHKLSGKASTIRQHLEFVYRVFSCVIIQRARISTAHTNTCSR